ncbi:MAG: MFS transporter [Candidatus Bipolaricaulota bacterium]|nr:MFS transporter [Candidatus Bipolaricaulota bacterium]
MSEAKKRARLVWYLYDFGNSAYAAVVLLAVYAAYFKEQVVGGSQGSFLWGLSVGIAMLIVALTSPILGAMADLTRSRKRFLAGYTAMACLFTVALFFVGKGDIVLGMALFILAEIGYRSAQVFYNSLLPDIAAQEEIGRISGNGWAIGSAGGIVCLVIVLITIRMIGGDFVVRFSLVITAIFFAVFAVPLFLWLREKKRRDTLPTGRSLIALPFVRVGKTLRAMRRYRQFGKFILAFLIYNDAILMTLNFAAILGAVLYGLNQQQLILFMILVQVTSIPGAYLLGRLADRTSAQKALILALGLMLSSVLWMYFNYSIHMFFVIGAIAGFALTGVQSVSRTMTGMLAPPGRSAEFYGFFAVAGRTSSFIGPTVFGIVAARMAAWYQTRGQLENLAEQSGQRIAVLVIAAFLIVGAGLLLTVNEYAGRRASMEAE